MRTVHCQFDTNFLRLKHTKHSRQRYYTMELMLMKDSWTMRKAGWKTKKLNTKWDKNKYCLRSRLWSRPFGWFRCWERCSRRRWCMRRTFQWILTNVHAKCRCAQVTDCSTHTIVGSTSTPVTRTRSRWCHISALFTNFIFETFWSLRCWCRRRRRGWFFEI